jgi:hypothetical protein
MSVHPATARTARNGLLAAISAAFAPLVFLITEAIAAIAWTAGTYDYGHNFISDLGTTVCGSTFEDRLMCSPLHGVMNFGYVAMGVGVAVTAALLASRLQGARRLVSIALGCLVAAGMILVASFHGGVESVDNGTIVLHVLGAVIAITLGNTLVIVMGANAGRLAFPRWYARAAIALGVIGLAGLVLLLSGAAFLDPAVFERVSVYAIFAGLLLTSGVQFALNRTHGGANAA